MEPTENPVGSLEIDSTFSKVNNFLILTGQVN